MRSGEERGRRTGVVRSTSIVEPQGCGSRATPDTAQRWPRRRAPPSLQDITGRTGPSVLTARGSIARRRDRRRKRVTLQVDDDHSRCGTPSQVARSENAGAIALVDSGSPAHGIRERLLSENTAAVEATWRGLFGQLQGSDTHPGCRSGGARGPRRLGHGGAGGRHPVVRPQGIRSRSAPLPRDARTTRTDRRRTPLARRPARSEARHARGARCACRAPGSHVQYPLVPQMGR